MEGLITMDIIIADDGVAELQFAQRVVSSYLLNPVHAVRNVNEALEAVFPPGEHEARVPQLVVASLDLPPTSGIELVRSLRCDSRTAMVPVVLVARSNEECERYRSRPLPRTTCIAGPLDLAKLSDALREIGMSWVLMDNPMTAPLPFVLPSRRPIVPAVV